MRPDLLLLLQSGVGSSPFIGMLPILAIFAIFYFLLFLPMQRQRRQQQKLLAGLQNGNTVVTNGGIIGTIVAVNDDTLIIRVKPDNVKLQVSRSAVSGLVPEESPK